MVDIIFRNIISGLKKYTGYILALIFVEISVVITIFFSYGVYLNYLNQKNDDVFGSRAISAAFSDRNVTVEDIRELEMDIESIFGSHLDSLGIETKQGNIKVIGIYENKTSEYSFTDQTVRQLVETGRYFSKEEEENAENVCLSYWEDGRGLVYCGKSYEQIGCLLNWYGDDYSEVVKNSPETYYVPYKSLPDTASVCNIEIHIDRRISAKMNNEFSELLEHHFMDKAIVYGSETIAETEKQLSEGMVIIIAIMFILASINIYFLTQYLYERRKKMYAIYRICGANRRRLFCILFSENMVLILLATIFGYILYDKCLVRILLERYKYFDEIYTQETYIKIGTIYLGAIVVLNIVLAVKQLIKTPVDMWRK